MFKDKSLSTPSVREAFPSDWPEWVLRCLERLDEAENFEECPFFEGAEEWTANMLAESMKSMVPNIRWTKKAHTGPEFLGALVGHQQYLLESENVTEALEKNCADISEGNEQHYAMLREQLNEEEYQKVMADIENDSAPYRKLIESMEKTIELKLAVLKDCVCIAQEQPFDELTDFSTAYSQSLNKPLFDKQGKIKHTTLTTEMYVIMALCWRKVASMKTLRHVYEWLKKLFNSPKVTTFERTRRSLNRRGLSLASRGRPKKEDTKPPSC